MKQNIEAKNFRPSLFEGVGKPQQKSPGSPALQADALLSEPPGKPKGGVICISEVIDISPGNLESSLYFFQSRFLMMYSVYKLSKQGDNIQL